MQMKNNFKLVNNLVTSVLIIQLIIFITHSIKGQFNRSVRIFKISFTPNEF